MLFSQDQDDQKKKKASILGFMFNPKIGREIQPMRESARMFVRMIALVFASYRLFPKDHPAFKDGALPLTMADVLGTAYRGLSFTKQGIPQIVLFLAVVGCMLFSALFIITLLMSMFVGSAHAQGIFESPVPTTDWGIGWIDYLFTGKSMADLSANGVITPPSSNIVQIAMGKALAFYSTAILALAGFLLIYHLIFMIAETAHTGKPMGKANQIWAPIRLVFAIGMLVPIGTGGGGTTVVGYNTAQYLAMQMGRWGSGLASTAWGKFVDGLNIAASLGVCPPGAGAANSPSCINTSQDTTNFVRALIAMDACAYITNLHIDKAGINKGTFSNPTWNPVSGQFSGSPSYYVRTLAEIQGQLDDVGRHYLHFKTKHAMDIKNIDYERYCGGIEVEQIADGPNNPYSGVYKAQQVVIRDLVPKIHDYVAEYAKESALRNIYADQALLTQRSAALQTLITDFDAALTSVINTELERSIAAAEKLANGNMEDHYKESGWLSAASWFSTITRVMSDRSSSVRNGLPIVLKPTGLDGSAEALGKKLKGIVDSTADDYQAFMGSVANEIAFIDHSGAAAEIGKGYDEGWLMSLLKSGSPVNILFKAIDGIGSFAGLWHADGLAIQFGGTNNAFAEIAAFGQNYIVAGGWLMSGGAFFYLAGSAGDSLVAQVVTLGASKVLGDPAAFIGGALIALSTFFYLIGFTFAFVIPLYPFYRFFFGSVMWIMSVFEAVVLAPLFALAHVNPYGEGLAGQYGKYGYSVMMQVLLRPILMVFGLIAGFLLFTACIHFLNDAFVVVTKGSGNYASGTASLAKLVYSVIYCMLVLLLTNQCFSTIGLFPQVALKYLGMQQISEEKIGDTHLLAAGAAWIGKDMLTSKVPGMLKSPGDAMGKRRDTADAGRTAEDRMRRQVEGSGGTYLPPGS